MTRDEENMVKAVIMNMPSEAFHAMVATLQEAAPNMLHKHVMTIQAAIDTARPAEPAADPSDVAPESDRVKAAQASNAAREAAKLAASVPNAGLPVDTVQAG